MIEGVNNEAVATVDVIENGPKVVVTYVDDLDIEESIIAATCSNIVENVYKAKSNAKNGVKTKSSAKKTSKGNKIFELF